MKLVPFITGLWALILALALVHGTDFGDGSPADSLVGLATITDAQTPSLLYDYKHGVLHRPRSRQATRQSVVLRAKMRERGLRARQTTTSGGSAACIPLGSTAPPPSGTTFQAGNVLNSDGTPTGSNVSLAPRSLPSGLTPLGGDSGTGQLVV